MAKQLLTESFSLDFQDKTMVVLREDLMEALGVSKKLILEGSGELSVLNVYHVPVGPVGVKNRNGRIYDESTWNPCIMQKQGEGAIGNLDHPLPGAQPSIKDGFGVWKNHKIETLTLPDGSKGKFLCADLFIANNDNGRHVQGLIDAGARVEASTRGYGDLDENSIVRDYQFITTDLVSISSGNVGFKKGDALPADRLPENIKVGSGLKESVEKPNKIEAALSNNSKAISGAPIMERLTIKKFVTEALRADSLPKAYFQLEEIEKEIAGAQGMEDILEDVRAKKASLQKAMTEEDNGSADPKVLHPADNKGIADTNETEPEDVDEIEVENIDDTDASDRTDSEQEFKPGSSAKAMGYEVMSGESPKSMLKKEAVELTIGPTTEVFETEDGLQCVEGSDGKIYAVNTETLTLTEETDESEPEDVEEIEVEDIEDERDVEGHEGSNEVHDKDNGQGTEDIKLGSTNENLYNLNKMSKSDLIDLAVSMSEALETLKKELQVEQACYATLSDKYLKLETYTLMGESVLNRDVSRMEKAQKEVVESVETISQLHSALEAANGQIAELQEGVTALEDHIKTLEETENHASAVTDFVNESLIQNPKLLAWESELKRAGSVTEARVLMAKYASMGGKARLDLPMTEAALGGTKVRLTEAQSARQTLVERGMM